MTLCDECETASHCAKHGCIPLTECIASGQVSAAQVVAHAEAGEAALQKLTEIGEATGWPEGMLQDDRNETMQELAATREQVRILREALTQGEALANGDLTGLEWKNECRRFLAAARAALAATQQGANHE